MGHYDDQRHAHDEKVERERAENIARYEEQQAASRGITVEQYRADELHRQKMKEGQAIYEEEVRRNELMVYYLKHLPGTAELSWPRHPGGTKK